jgi:hypothetical protein
MKLIILCLSLAVLNGCTNYLYKGQIIAEDSKGRDRDVIIYWTKTSPLLGGDKAGPASLLTECGSLVSFDEQEQGIFFRGEPGKDRFADSQTPVKNGDICGKFLNEFRFVDIGSGALELSILCIPEDADDFSLFQRSYVSAKHSPYKFNVIEFHDWSFLGKSLPAPSVPDCRDAE